MKSYLTKIDLFSIVIGSIIGWGAFMLPGTKFLQESGIINTALGLSLGAICIMIIEYNYRVMMEEHDEEGGEFSYTYNILGKNHGFIVGWFLLLAYFTMIPLNATAFPLVIEKVFGDILKFGYIYNVAGVDVYLGEVLVSNVIVILFAYFNIKGIKNSSKIQNKIIFTLIILVAVIFITMFIKSDRNIIIDNYISNYKFNLKQVLTTFAITPFAFVGFDAIPQLSKEYKFSAKKASLVAIISLSIGTLIYNALNIITAMAYSPYKAKTLEWALGSAVSENLGRLGFVLLVIALIAAISSGINGFMICSSKLIGSIADYKILPRKFGELNNKGVLKNAIIFISVVSLIAPWFGRTVIIWIVDMASLGASIAYMYVSYIAMRKARNFKSKIMSLLGTSISLLFILLLLIPMSPASLGKESLIALGIWILLGFIFLKFGNLNEK
ncbi:amino acid permease family protein [[Clostridium] bifermentans ATCC 638]|uniref:Amino acid permease family protein n=1 Tax=Paraclostridium bifermentans ATCC 638 = DSM 14991 TaxID=1233171 RepID=T4VSS0_PARBF|nr:APC family permease [Paraclostridium bifermentans]EQK43737.1 amino acid permease family protein [[Clostridium] bifermentans ATCC 638] [Paraclostridium bifermentans ATCC 638 = DSM 14991]RIZ59564.1 APC family permease [Paraclostridium bifermentans]UAG17572.1 APC family permease [Paraclostridium bifermentans]